MIRLLLFCLAVLGLGAFGAWFLRSDEGYVLLSFQGWVIETTATGFALAVLALCLTAVLAWRLLSGAVGLPARVRDALARRRENRARESFVRGLGHLAAEDWKRAEVDLVRRAADHDRPQLNYLFAAHAARRAGHADRCEQYLALARDQSGDTVPVQLARAEMLREDGRAADAIPILEAVLKNDPRHRPAAALLCEVLAEAGDWAALQRRLMSVERRKVLEPDRWQVLMQQAALGRIEAASQQGRLEALREVWAELPRGPKDQVPVRNRYLRALVTLNAERQALELIARAVSADWDAELVELYGRIDGGDPVSQLATVEAWLNKYGERPELLLVAGQTCLRNRLWGKARSYLDGAIKLQPTPAAYLALARLCQETRQADEARQWYRRGLELATEQAA